MKINIQVELDWLDEEGNIDEIMQDSLISGVKSAISQQCLKRVEDKASKAIDKAIDEAISNAEAQIAGKALEFFSQWLETDVVVSNKWGEEAKRGSIKDIIKGQFDSMMNEVVDSSGKIVGQGGYGAKTTVVKYLSGVVVKELVESQLKDYSKELDSKIKEEVNNGIKKNVSDLFAQMVVNTAKQQHAELNAIEHKN